jgi:hypothetical protein
MYAESRINDKLIAATRVLGFAPVYHSVKEAQYFVQHIKSLEVVQPDGDIVLGRNLTKKETEWIRNERMICYADQQYFATRYCYVSDEENRLVLYQPRQSQRVFHRLLQFYDEQQLSIEIIALKARQQGISTEVELKFAHRVLFTPGAKAICGSADGQKSELMAKMFYLVIDECPWWLKPQVKTNRRAGNRGLIEFATASIVAVQTGSQETGIGQGWTPTCAHLSECVDYDDPGALIEEGLFKAMHTSPGLFLLLESTGNGATGWWADTWRSSKEFFPQGRARLCPVFLPWWLCSDMFPKKEWLDKFPIPEGWRPARETVAHANKCRAFVRATEYLRREVGEGWELPRQQQWFWEFNYEEHKRKGIAKSWLRQMPCDDYEALMGKNDSVFDSTVIEVVEQRRARDFQVFGLTGEGVDEKNEPPSGEVDYSLSRIKLGWESNRGTLFEWQMVPLKSIRESDEQTAQGKWLIFEEPVPGCDYSVGVDAAGGVGEDNTIISVVRKGNDEAQDIQAAEYASCTLSSAEAAPFCAAIGAWYGLHIPVYGQVKYVIEQTRKYGDDCQLQLKRMGMRRHHDMIRYDNKKIEPTKAHKQGWFTGSWSRPLLLGRFVNAIENYWFKVNSPFLVKELMDFEQRHTSSGLARMEHQQGKHDDRIFASGMAYFTNHHLDVMMERSQKRYHVPREKLPEVDMTPWTGLEMPVSGVMERW